MTERFSRPFPPPLAKRRAGWTASALPISLLPHVPDESLVRSDDVDVRMLGRRAERRQPANIEGGVVGRRVGGMNVTQMRSAHQSLLSPRTGAS